jgi:hypothetical protein
VRDQSVVLTNPNATDGSLVANGGWNSHDITLQGIVFGPAPYVIYSAAVNAAQGWVVEDCRFQDNCGLGIRGDIGAPTNGDDVLVTRCVFQDTLSNAAFGYGNAGADPPTLIRDTTFRDCIIRRSNTMNFDPGWSAGAFKFLYTSGFVLDGLISYDNNGSGGWFDTANHDLTVENCTFFGNHAGAAHSGQNGAIVDSSWAGIGLQIEADPGPVTVTGSTFYSNLRDGIYDSSSGSSGTSPGDPGVAVRGNVFDDNASDIHVYGGTDGTQNRKLGPAAITGNVFLDWRASAWYSVGLNGPRPSDDGVVFDGNAYDPLPDYAGVWGTWAGHDSQGLADMRRALGAEQAGTQVHRPFPGQLPLNSISAYPTEHDVADNAIRPEGLHQVAADESSSIDAAIGRTPVGRVVTIPVFGHTPLTGSGPYTCRVYDLVGRWLTLTLPTGRARGIFAARVTGYCRPTATPIRIRLKRNDPYDVEGIFLG